MRIQYKYNVYFLLVLFFLAGCTKYLDKKQDQSLAIPSTLGDFQALLDNNTYVNIGSTSQGEQASDNYYLTDATWASLSSQGDRNAYIWGDELYYSNLLANPWQNLYYNILLSNTILTNFGNVTIKPQDIGQAQSVKGQAYFLRAKSYYSLAISFVLAFDSTTADKDLGLPLRTTTDITQGSVRSTVRETYQIIIDDLKAAISLLPNTAAHLARGSKTAAYGLLARTYLTVRDYTNASKYADSALLLSNTLMDFNTLTATATYPIANYNTEMTFFSAFSPTMLSISNAKIDTSLYASYAANDLRKTVFFVKNTDNSYGFKGSYTGSLGFFNGIANDEIYLIKAECAARAGNTPVALDNLNALMIKRWKAGTFIPFTASSPSNALQLILSERRKELIMRDLRFMDVKRLNKEGANITLTRVISGTPYQLAPNDPKSALPFPDYVIQQSGMEQNPR